MTHSSTAWLMDTLNQVLIQLVSTSIPFSAGERSSLSVETVGDKRENCATLECFLASIPTA